MSWRCKTCNGLIGPEDADGANTQPALCTCCRKQAAANPWAVAGRQQKALAMVCVIDAKFRQQFPKLDPFDQAGRIRLASFTWSDEQWESIGALALKPNGTHYERKPISRETRDMIREIYQGRATAPLASRAS